MAPVHGTLVCTTVGGLTGLDLPIDAANQVVEIILPVQCIVFVSSNTISSLFGTSKAPMN